MVSEERRKRERKKGHGNGSCIISSELIMAESCRLNGLSCSSHTYIEALNQDQQRLVTVAGMYFFTVEEF